MSLRHREDHAVYNAAMSMCVLAAMASASAWTGPVPSAWTPQVATGAPYPPSNVVRRVEFDFATHRRLAPGSDNWPITWARNGLQYTAWGDGGGFGGTNERGRASNGFAVVRGTARDYAGQNLAGGFGAVAPAPFTGKCYGVLALRGMLYAWRTGDESGETAYAFQELWRSADNGKRWLPTGVRYSAAAFPRPDRGFFAPTFVQHGRDHRLARDGWVYACAANVKTERWDIHLPGEIVLLRARERDISDPAAWTFHAGLDAAGRPKWTRDPSARQPIWTDRTGGAMMVSVAWNPALRRYLLMTEHGRTASGNIGVFEAPELWGPWRTILYTEGWGSDRVEPTAFYWSFAPAWWSGDGLSFVMVFTGTGANDAWNTVEGRFRVAPGPAPVDARVYGARSARR